MNALALVHLRRSSLVFLEEGGPMAPLVSVAAPVGPEKELVATGVAALEADLVEMGYVLAAPLARALRGLSAARLATVGDELKGALARELGANAMHVPLFRGFPATVPDDTCELYLIRLFAWLWTAPDQPCPMCGTTREIHAVNPCGHLVCGVCWDGADYSGCPICHRRIDLDTPFLKGPPGLVPPPKPAPAPAVAKGEPAAPAPKPPRFRLLQLGEDGVGKTHDLYARLLGRATPLSPADRSDLLVILQTARDAAIAWLPERITVKETMALAIGTLVRAAARKDVALRASASHLRTATDVLRVLMVLFGGAPDLVTFPKVRSMPRALRRAVLETLEGFELSSLAEDVRRHARLWQRVGHGLHVFEHAARFPKAAAVFAAVRGTEVARATAPLRPALDALAGREAFRPHGGRLTIETFAAKVEAALRVGDSDRATTLLRTRPGVLLRRADWLLRTSARGPAERRRRPLEALTGAVERGAPAMLLTLRSHLAHRRAPLAARTFFPKAPTTLVWTCPDRRRSLDGDATTALIDAITRELLERAGRGARFAGALLDEALAAMPAPMIERTAARALVATPRGSVFPLPEGTSLRFFMHWMQSEKQRVDLDLSAAFYDANWDYVARCDFGSLRVTGAVHSGDLTSAPPPLAASEFIDLHTDELRKLGRGVRYVVPGVFSYNAVPFDGMPEAFAGVLAPIPTDRLFDPKAVVQRFDLQGPAEILVPLVLDLEERTIRWLDLNLTPAPGTYRTVFRSAKGLAMVVRGVATHYATGVRPSMWELACLHAAARTGEVEVRRRRGERTPFLRFRRDAGETVYAFFRRLVALEGGAPADAAAPQREPIFAALLRDDVAIPRGSTAYILDRRALTGEDATLLAASDLVAQLARSR